MSLTITEQMQLIKGTVKPPSNELIDLVYQSAMKYAFDFFANYKVFSIVSNATPPVAINADAERYVTKQMVVANNIFNADQPTIGALKRIIVTIIGASSVTLAQVVAANDTAWESTIGTNMPRAFELLAGVTKRELANYTTPVAP